MANRYFTPDTFDFPTALAANHRREWFDEHKPDYEAMVRTPALNLISDITTDSGQIRDAVVDQGNAWLATRDDTTFWRDIHALWRLADESTVWLCQRPPVSD